MVEKIKFVDLISNTTLLSNESHNFLESGLLEASYFDRFNITYFIDTSIILQDCKWDILPV